MSEGSGAYHRSLRTGFRWNEAELVREVKAGNEDALQALLHRHWTNLVRYALRFVDAQDQAEDIVQEAFVRLWSERADWRREDSFRPVLYQITRNLALNEKRRQATFLEWARRNSWANTDRRPAPHRRMQQAELQAAVQKALDALPERRREIFLLVRTHQMTYREAGRILNISPQTVANQISKAMHDLREALEPFLDAADPEELPFPRREAG